MTDFERAVAAATEAISREFDALVLEDECVPAAALQRLAGLLADAAVRAASAAVVRDRTGERTPD